MIKNNESINLLESEKVYYIKDLDLIFYRGKYKCLTYIQLENDINLCLYIGMYHIDMPSYTDFNYDINYMDLNKITTENNKLYLDMATIDENNELEKNDKYIINEIK